MADFTANWAGPIVGHLLALLGAEVIHIEGGKRAGRDPQQHVQADERPGLAGILGDLRGHEHG